MEEKKNIFQNKKLLLIIPVLLVVAVIGVTYAFFNYTRTGGTNTVTTGRIAFNTDQNNDTLLLTNVFPSSSVPVNADSVAVHITGDTTYNDGEEFQITLVDVVNTVNGKTVPINYVATYTATATKDIGTSKATDDAYFGDRGSTTSVYKLTSSGEVSEGTEVLKGFIAKGATGIDGVLTIQAYLDSSKVLISDTIQDGAIEVSGYVNGTPGAGMTVLTTAEWNALTGANTLSFKIRAISNEGTWVEDPTLAVSVIKNVSTLETTPYGKIYTGSSPNNYVRFNNEYWRILGVYTDPVNGDMLKIVEAYSTIYTLAYNSVYSDGNVWSGSTAQIYLNGTFYDSLQPAAQEMIFENGRWYVGAVSNSDNASEAYANATTATTYNGITYQPLWTGKVGLVSVYEYLYTAGNSNGCWAIPGYNYNPGTGCQSTDWLYGTITVNNDSWLMNPSTSYSGNANYAQRTYGSVQNTGVPVNYDAYPVVYLKHDVKITGGTGEYGANAYTLSYTAS